MLVYILYSTKADSFYTGFTTDTIENRLQKHLADYYENKFTSNVKDWTIFLTINCSSTSQARKIETHIKKMKSKKYILNLKKHPAICQILIQKYKDS